MTNWSMSVVAGMTSVSVYVLLDAMMEWTIPTTKRLLDTLAKIQVNPCIPAWHESWCSKESYRTVSIPTWIAYGARMQSGCTVG